MSNVYGSTTQNEGICPVSGTRGKRVDSATVKSMLNISLLALRNVTYYFCREANCDVVYFSADGTQTFSVSEVRERVFQKEPNDETVPVCYCFRHTPASIRAEIEGTGDSTVIQVINAGIHAGQCACDWRNPQGDCCLGNVSALVKRYRAEKA